MNCGVLGNRRFRGGGYEYPASIISRWTGGSLTDLVGSNDMTNSGGSLTTNRFGEANSAFDLAGAAYLSVADDATLDIFGANESASLSLWLKPVSLPLGSNIFGKYGGGADRAFEVTTTTTTYVLQQYDGTTNPYVSSTSKPTGAFILMGFVRDHAAGELRINIDGVDVSTTPESQVGFAVDFNNAAALVFGAASAGVKTSSIIFDEAAFYGEALTTADWVEMYEGTKP